MVRTEQWMDIKELERQGVSQRQIARQTGLSRNTVARLLNQKVPTAFQAPERASKLDPFKPFVRQRWETYALSATRLFEDIQAQGYSGSVNLVQRYLRSLKEQQRLDARATVRFETAPGEQAQADWAYTRDIEGRKAYVFVLVLSFSRLLYVELTDSMSLPALLRCHQNAFTFLGGVPQRILYDNMAQVRQVASRTLNPLMADFAAHYGFSVRTHRPYRPRTKGKVERAISYVEDNFLNGRDFDTLQEANGHALSWMHKANSRIHGTTGEKPVVLFETEKSKLAALDQLVPYVLAQHFNRRVDVESFVQVARSRYSVPPEYIGQQVIVVLGEQKVTVRLGQMIIATHRIAERPGACVADPDHVTALWSKTVPQEVLEAARAGKSSQQRKPEDEPHQLTPQVRPLSVYAELFQ